jgi:general stress protein 26
MTSAEKKLDDLYQLIDGIEIAMFTTRRPDGHLVTRPMQVQERTTGTDLWFVTDVETHKLDELAHDPHVNPRLLQQPLAGVRLRERHDDRVIGPREIAKAQRIERERRPGP